MESWAGVSCATIHEITHRSFLKTALVYAFAGNYCSMDATTNKFGQQVR